MKSRTLGSLSFFHLFIVAALALLFLAVGGCNRTPLSVQGNTQVNPEAAMFVPKQAPMMASLLVNPDRVEALLQAAVPAAERRQMQTELQQFRQGLLVDTGLEYKRDMQPWLGDELTFAVATLDIDRIPENGQQPGYLVVAATADPVAAREFLQVFWQQRAIAGSDLIFETYNGIEVIHSAPIEAQASVASSALATAVVGDRFVLFANHPKVLRQAINNVQAPDLSLASSLQYQQTLDSLTAPKIGFAFLNLPVLATWMGQPQAKMGEFAPTAAPTDSQPYQQVAMGLGLTHQGLLAETALLGSNEAIAAHLPALSQPVGALRYLPATSAISLSSTNLNQIWQHIEAGSKAERPLAKLVDRSSIALSKKWGIALSQDIFSWVKEDYALALLSPKANSDQPEAPLDWVFVSHKSADSEAAIAQLDRIATEQGLSVGTLTLTDKPISLWTKLTPITTTTETGTSSIDLTTTVFGVHASQGEYNIFATSIDAMAAALQADRNSLLDSNRFKDAIAALPQSNDGYFYLNWPASQAILEQQFPLIKLIELAGKPIFDRLNAIAFSGSGSEPGIYRSQIFLQLNRSTH